MVVSQGRHGNWKFVWQRGDALAISGFMGGQLKNNLRTGESKSKTFRNLMFL